MNIDEKKISIKFILLLLMAVVASTLSLPSSAFITPETSIKLHLTNSATITDLAAQNRQELTPNSDVDFKLTTPLQVEMKGHLPLIIVPIKEGVTDIKLNPPSYKEAIQSYGQREISQILSELLIEVQNIQKMIQKRDLDQAQERISKLQAQYPELAFLDFIRGSVLFLQGKKAEAREAVKKALEFHPDYEEGKAFLKNLGEESSQGDKK